MHFTAFTIVNVSIPMSWLRSIVLHLWRLYAMIRAKGQWSMIHWNLQESLRFPNIEDWRDHLHTNRERPEINRMRVVGFHVQYEALRKYGEIPEWSLSLCQRVDQSARIPSAGVQWSITSILFCLRLSCLGRFCTSYTAKVQLVWRFQENIHAYALWIGTPSPQKQFYQEFSK